MGIGITNIGTVPITWNAPVLSGPNASDFSVVSTCPASLTPNAICAVNVTASPTQPTNGFATLTLTDSTGTLQQVTSLAVFGQNPSPGRQPKHDQLCLYAARKHQRAAIVHRDQLQQRSRHRSGCRLIPIALCHHPGKLLLFNSMYGLCCLRTHRSQYRAQQPATIRYGNILVTDLFSAQAALVSLSGIYPAATTPTPNDPDH